MAKIIIREPLKCFSINISTVYCLKKEQRNVLQNIPGSFTLIMSVPYLKNIIRRNSWVINSHVLGIASLAQGMP